VISPVQRAVRGDPPWGVAWPIEYVLTEWSPAPLLGTIYIAAIFRLHWIYSYRLLGVESGPAQQRYVIWVIARSAPGHG